MPLRHHALTLTAIGSLLALATPAFAAPTPAPAKITAVPRTGAAQLPLTPAQRTALIGNARSTAADTARRIGLGAEEKLVVKDVMKDADGTLHTRYDRTYAGLPVLGGDLVVHDKGGRTTVTRANAARIEVPSLSAAGSGRLVIWAGGSGSPALARETVVKGVQKDGTPSELQIITDAATGRRLQAVEQVHTGTGTGQYAGEVPLGTTLSGPVYQLADPGRAGQKTYDLGQGSTGTGTLFTDGDDVWGNGLPSDRQTAGVDAAFGAAATWDYFRDAHGRNGIRGDGVAAYSRTHYGNNYANAFWQDSCFCMTYGDGRGNTHPLTSLDVAAHEMSHGVTAATARLVYSGESGGLNEATSDIFAAAVEFHENLPADPGDYLVGEKIDIRGTGAPLRYMDKPSKDGSSRDSWNPNLGTIDVHYSSGPANHFFYLLSEGSGARTVNGVAYDSPTSDGRPVTGIGIENAAAIWYRALTTYMVSTTNYAGARTATLSAAADLFGAYSPTYLAVADAWAAVNVGNRVVVGVNLAPIDDQISGVGQDAGLQLDAYTTNTGATLTYEATGLPTGLTLTQGGLITGTLTALGTADVTIRVTDSTGSSVSDAFTWQTGHTYTNTTHLDIPDRGPAVESPITITGRDGNASATTSVHVNIVHPWRSDLVVDLIGPDGTAYSLSNRAGGPNENIDQTFVVDASGQPVQGTWKLRVQDRLVLFAGYLARWHLTP